MTFRAVFRDFLRQDDGGSTVEAVPWIGVIGIILALSVDASSTYQSQAHVLRSIQDANRLVSIGAIRDAEVAAQFAEFQIMQVYPDADATTVIDSDIGVVATTVSIPWASFHLAGWLASFNSDTVTFSAAHLLEWS